MGIKDNVLSQLMAKLILNTSDFEEGADKATKKADGVKNLPIV